MAEQDLSHVDTIIEDLAPLASKQRGAPLRADDWNVLVDAVRELALIARGRASSAADALAANYSPIDHEHLGEIGLAWFDGPTRALVEGRSQAEFTIRDDITRLDKGVTALRTDVQGLRSDLDGLKELVLQLRGEVLGSNRDVGKVKLRVEALADVSLGVDRITRDFAKLDGRLSEVLTLRDQIGVGEGQVDLAGLDSRLGSLEQMRQQLIGGSQVPDLRVLQQDLIKLNDRMAEVGPGAPIDLSDASKAQLEQLIEAEMATTKARLDALDTKTTATEELLSQQAATLGKLADYDAGLTRIGVLESSLGDYAGKFEELDGRTTDFGTQLGALDGKLAGIDSVIDQKLANIDLGGVDAEALAGLGTRVTQLESGLTKLDEQFVGLGDLDSRFADKASLEQLSGTLAERTTQLDTLAQNFAEAGAGLDDLGSRLGTLEGSMTTLGDWRGTVDNKLGELANLDGGESSAALALRVSDLESSMTTWNTWRSGATSRIDALEVGAVSANEARTALAEQLSIQVAAQADFGEQLGTLSSSLDGLSSWRGTIDGQLETLGTRTGELEAWKVDAIAEFDTLDGMKLGEFDSRLTATASSLESLAKTAGETQLALESSTTALGEWRGTVDAKLGELANLDGGESSAALALRVTDVEASLSHLNNWRTSTTTRIDSLEVGLVASNESRTLLANRLADQQTLLSGLGEQVGTMSKSLDGISEWRGTIDGQLETLGTRTGELEAWQTEASKELDGLEGMNLGEFDGRLAATESTLSSLTKSVDQFSTTLESQATRLSSAEGSITTLSKDLNTTKTSVSTLSESLATTSKTVDSLSTWRGTVDGKIGSIETTQSSLLSWQSGVDSKLSSVDQSLSSYSSLSTRVNSLETTTKSLSTWRSQTDTTLSSMQVDLAKTTEYGTRLDKMDSQLLASKSISPAISPLRVK